MPDLMTHVAISHLIKRPFELKQESSKTVPMRTVFYLGTILPDVLSRPFYILFPVTREWVSLYHHPVGFILIATLFALFFDPTIWKRAWMHLMAGGMLHFLLDSFQKQIASGIAWLWPFSWRIYGYGLMEAGDILHYIPLWISLIIIMEMGFYYIRRKRQTHSVKEHLV
ncbi:hypothetical protein JW824_15185 [bacterium]|nr:hypothetical protein [bacterium]